MTDWIAAVKKMKGYVDTYLAIPNPTPKQKAALQTDLKTLDVDLAALAAAQQAAPASPGGLTNWGAAQLDAGFVLQESLGNYVGADTNPAPGAAKALGFNGVVGTGNTYATFKGGELVDTSATNPGEHGFNFAFGLAAGIDPDGSYTGPGALRP